MRVNWRAIRRWSIGLVLLAILVGPFTWWQVSARADVLQRGDASYGGSATLLHAGDTTEYCFPDKPGSTVVFGFSILNTGSHDVKVQSIDEIIGMADQKITVDPETNGGSAGPQASTQTLPLTIRPGQNRELYVAMHLSTSIVNTSGGEVHFDSVVLHVRSLGLDRTQNFPLGDDFNPVWIGISGIDDNGNACGPNA